MASSLLVETIAGIRARVAAAREAGLSVGLAPTMGALHQGHAALIRRARAENGFVVVTVFVNPTQFNQAGDFDTYPRAMGEDLALCQSLGVDAVFAPETREMYPDELLTSVEVAEVSAGLCGAFRPGHFRGVATVVAKLFHIVAADRAYFGEKDAQQLAVIRKMAADLNFPVEIVAVETVREPDGLALSSRNRRLSPEDRRAAPELYRALQAAAARAKDGPAAAREAALALLARVPGMRVEYLEVVDAGTMQPVEKIEGAVRIAAAVWLGGVRLIDNVGVG
jgi:pantoate--beta-alanine ligase